MKIAFDVDGVLRAANLGFFKICVDGKLECGLDALHLTTISAMPPLLNPFLLATKEDEVYALTNCDSEWSANQKRSWLNHFYGDRIRFLSVEVPTNLWKREYCDAVAKAKVEVMLREGIELYFDDDPAIIRVMRSLTSKVKFVKYGPWVDEYY